MIKLTRRSKIEFWLQSQQPDVVSVIAARSALRAVPLLGNLIENEKFHEPLEVVILPCFWSISIALSAGNWPDKAGKLLASSAYSATAICAPIAHNADARAADVIYAAAHAVTSVVGGNIESAAAAIIAASRAARASLAEYSLDCDCVDRGQTAQWLTKQRLWNDDVNLANALPFEYREDWHKLKSYLIARNRDWNVWTDWYEARLLGQPLIEEIEVGLRPENFQYGRATLPPEYYKKPAKANATIRKNIKDYWGHIELDEKSNQLTQSLVSNSFILDTDVYIEKSDVPPQNPATIKPVIRNGKIFLSDKPLDADLEIELAIANMLALRDEFEEFFTSMESEGNFDKRPLDFLKTISALIPNDIPDSRVLFRLIRKEATMEKYETTVLQEWPQFFADRYSSLLTELGQVLDQFPDRRAFQRHKLSVEIEDVDYEEFTEDFAPVLDAIIKEKELIDPTVPKAIQEIGELSDGPPLQDEQRVIIADQLDSTNNLLKALTDKTLDPMARQQAILNIGNAYASGFEEGVLKGAREAGVNDGQLTGATVVRVEATKTVGKALYEKYPERYGWLKRIFKKRT